MTHRRALLPRAALLVLAATACASADPGSSSAVGGPSGGRPRTIAVEMVDLAFAPERIEVAEGETVRLEFRNAGHLPHDAFIGDAAAQARHGDEMGEGHGGHGSDDDAVSVEPGGTASLVHTFGESGEVLIGCHQPGHYEAGMLASVVVA
jgi:uncharacterized cupredoxin-like copper-binding protein